VRLEVALLEADRAAPANEGAGEQSERAVLVVASEFDLRQYVRECLRDRTDLRAIDATSVVDCVDAVAHVKPILLIVAEAEEAAVRVFPHLLAILIVNDESGRTSETPRRRILARPFTAERLLAEVVQLLG